MAAKAGEEAGAALKGVEQVEAVNGAAGAVGDAVFNADDDGGPGGALDDAGGKDADDAAMPSLALDDEEAGGGEIEVRGEAGFDGFEGRGLGVAALAVEALEFGGEFGGAVGVAGGEELDDFRGDVHAAGGVDAGGKAEGDVKAGELFGGGVKGGGGEERAEAGAGGGTQLTQAKGGDGAIFSAEGDGIGDGGDGGHFEKAGESLFAGAGQVAALEDGLGEFESDGRAAEGFLWVRAVGLIGIEDGEGVGKLIAGGAEMVVGNDEVEAEAAGSERLSEGAHAGVNGDDEANAFSIRGFKDGGLEAVALVEAVGDVEADLAAEHLNGGFEQDNGGGSVYVVVAVQEDGLLGGDGLLKAGDGGGHAEHQEGVVEMSDLRVEEGEGLSGTGDAAGDEELGEDQGQAGGFGEGLCLVRVRVSQLPALTGHGRAREGGLRGRGHGRATRPRRRGRDLQ